MGFAFGLLAGGIFDGSGTAATAGFFPASFVASGFFVDGCSAGFFSMGFFA
jgi:hypothetical protein